MNVPFEIRVTMAVECAACPGQKPERAIIADNMRLEMGTLIPYPRLPSRWRLIDGQPICPKHEVTIVDKGASIDPAAHVRLLDTPPPVAGVIFGIISRW